MSGLLQDCCNQRPSKVWLKAKNPASAAVRRERDRIPASTLNLKLGMLDLLQQRPAQLLRLVPRLAGEPVCFLACFRRPRGIPSQHIGRTLDQLNRLRGNAGRVPAALLRPHSRD